MAVKQDEVLELISNTCSLYIKNSNTECNNSIKFNKDSLDFVSLYRIDEVTYEEESPRKEALENVIASMQLDGIVFVYLIVGDEKGVNFYYGVARDYSDSKLKMEISDVGNTILRPSLQGNFRGSKITELTVEGNNKLKGLLDKINSFEKVKIIEGVPGINKDDEDFQTVDRIVDVMLGSEFVFMLLAKPLNQKNISDIQNSMWSLYDIIAPISKTSIQNASGTNSSETDTHTTQTSHTEGKNSSDTHQESKGDSKQHTEGKNNSSSTTTNTGKNTSKGSSVTETESGGEQTTEGSNTSDTTGENSSSSDSKTTGDSKSDSSGESDSNAKQTGSNLNVSSTIEMTNKKVQNWVKYLDEVVFPRLDYGLGKGLFLSTAVVMGKYEADLVKLENTIRSVYGGESGNMMPMRAFDLSKKEKELVKRFQIPELSFENGLTNLDKYIRMGCSQVMSGEKTCLLGSWLSSKELSLFASLPQKEVVGLSLREEVEFGLNVNTDYSDDSIMLGHMVQSGVVLDGSNETPNIEVKFEKQYFDKHVFVTGVTGSGKTTTCQKLLLESNANFLVIEPAKTEYRVLAETYGDDLLVFTLGKETGAPFRLNPFEFLKGESITSRVDMIMASMEAAFDMEAAIPQLLETAIYECYEDKGWDISNDSNRKYDDPFDGNAKAFPTLGELEKKIVDVVNNQGFDERLKNDYIGSIKARLKGLTVGAKGMMLNTPRSIDFVELLDRKVVLELENIKNASEKSLIMGFVLANLSEAIRTKYNQSQMPIRHITLVEEAHRLLSKYSPGDSLSKKQGVEMFADLLAEVRKYGESLIIVDQIPNKLTDEVLKNTNTKIVHKIFAQDDKDAIGNTMALSEEQKGHLSYLETGNAVMMNPGLNKAIQFKIIQDDRNDTERIPPKDNDLRLRILKYYAKTYKSGVLPGLETFEYMPDTTIVDTYLSKFQNIGAFMQAYNYFVHHNILKIELVDYVSEISEVISLTDVSGIIVSNCYSDTVKEKYFDLQSITERVLNGIKDLKQDYIIKSDISRRDRDKLNSMKFRRK